MLATDMINGRQGGWTEALQAEACLKAKAERLSWKRASQMYVSQSTGEVNPP
ncbi:MAG TPA: hypothetical protein VGQ71_11305 [Terriglobales bacterium]|nr:hypothetical protein [Terriglobales bacterium]